MPRGYNADGTKCRPPSNKGKCFSAEHRKKMSQSNTGKKHSDKTKKVFRQRDISYLWKQENIKKSALARTGQKRSEATKELLRTNKLENKNPNWIGDKVGYSAVHSWVRRRVGYKNKCQICGSRKHKRYELANIDHRYKRRLEDYVEVCCRCHHVLDKNIRLRNPKYGITRQPD